MRFERHRQPWRLIEEVARLQSIAVLLRKTGRPARGLTSFLILSAQTSHAAIEAALPPQFSGNFSVTTSILRPEIKVNPIQDRDRRRRREVEVTREDKRVLEGNVVWFDHRGRREPGGGIIDVRTSLLPAFLIL